MQNKHTEEFELSQKTLREVAGILGFLLPIVLVVLGLIFSRSVQGSISAYYDLRTRDIFVGALWAIGFILWAYKGYDSLDAAAGKVVCVLALGVALFPYNGGAWIGWLHHSFAAVLFVVLAYFSLFLFTKTKHSPQGFWQSFSFHFDEIERDDVQKRRRNKVYVACGLFMLACIVFLLLYNALWQQTAIADFIIKPLLLAETLMLWAFSISWSIKGEWGVFWWLWLKDK